jgi:arylsulfatase A-like enzyme
MGPPHCPYHTAPPEYHDLYAGKHLRLLPNVDPDQHVQTEHAKWGMMAPNSTIRDILAGYYAHCSAVDAAFGRIMQALDRLGLRQNTLVIFTSDHGDMLFSHGHGWKGKPWRESVGIPMLMRWPGRTDRVRGPDAHLVTCGRRAGSRLG